jgi:hypothetical protein
MHRLPQTSAAADPNWVCFSEAAMQDHAHNLFKEPGLRSFLPFANWLCFAQFPPPAACGGAKSGSFRTVRPQIGFVLHGRHPGRPLSIRNPQSPIRNPGPAPKLGSFCTNRPPGYRGHGAATGPSPAVRWGLSLGSRCLCGELIVSRRGTKSVASQVKADPHSADPAHRRRRPRPLYRRFSNPVCCTKTKTSTNISPPPKKPNVPFSAPYRQVRARAHDAFCALRANSTNKETPPGIGPHLP